MASALGLGRADVARLASFLLNARKTALLREIADVLAPHR